MGKRHYSSHLCACLTNLILQKATQEEGNFNASKLADAINVPRSVITRLIQPNPRKRVSNPKLDTLIKIVTYFNDQGFNITLDSLVGLNNFENA